MDEAIQLGLDLYENKARAVVGEAYWGVEREGRRERWERQEQTSDTCNYCPKFSTSRNSLTGLSGPPKKKREQVAEEVSCEQY